MRLSVKPGVRLHGLNAAMTIAVLVAYGLYEEAGADEVTITAGIDGAHTDGSAHYCGNALDFRSKNLNTVKVPGVVSAMQQSLGPDFFVQVEALGGDNAHIHVQFKPRATYTG